MQSMGNMLRFSLVAFACSLASSAFASGGPVDKVRLNCTSTGSSPQLVVVRLEQAPSSETVGDMLIYRGNTVQSGMETSLERCITASRVGQANNARPNMIVCGSPSSPTSDDVVANRAGWLAQVWPTGSNYTVSVRHNNQVALGGDLTCRTARR